MKKIIKILALITFCIITIWSCANRGTGPQGGPKDTTPPKLIKCTPENGATNVTTNKINLTFDEIVLVQNTFEKVLISPPQQNPPEVKAIGKKSIRTQSNCRFTRYIKIKYHLYNRLYKFNSR